MAYSKIEERVLTCVATLTGWRRDRLTAQTTLGQELGMDAADVRDLRTSLNATFTITLDDAVLTHWHTIGDVVQSITTHTAKPR